MPRRRTSSLAGVAAVLLASACGSSTEDATGATSGSTAAATATAPGGTSSPEAASAEAVVPELLRFTAPLVGGATFDAATLAGTPTVFWFWAPT